MYNYMFRIFEFNSHLEANDPHFLFVNIGWIIKSTTLSYRYVFISTTEVLLVNDDVIRLAIRPSKTSNKNTNIFRLKSNLWKTLYLCVI